MTEPLQKLNNMLEFLILFFIFLIVVSLIRILYTRWKNKNQDIHQWISSLNEGVDKNE